MSEETNKVEETAAAATPAAEAPAKAVKVEEPKTAHDDFNWDMSNKVCVIRPLRLEQRLTLISLLQR